MRILLVAMSNSLHTARWLRQLEGEGHDVHLFPSIDIGIVHPDVPSEVKTYRSTRLGASMLVRAFRKIFLPPAHLDHLCRLIERLKPDVIHSMEIQAAGYLTREAKRRVPGEFPPWLVTNWGSDIYHFGKFPEHAPRIRETLTNCDYFHCEGERDTKLAREFGFTGKVFVLFPITGGFDVVQARRLRSPLPPSKRRKIMLKGYQGWTGRALVGLKALEQCADVLAGYELCVYVPEVAAQAQALGKKLGLKVTVVPFGTPHADMMRHHGSARVSLGVSMSDGMCTSFMEALLMGSFPIQSNTCTADEWLENGKNCLLVPPEDADAVAAALRRALTDDALVDTAAAANIVLAENTISDEKIAPLARGLYTFILDRRRASSAANGNSIGR
ncbi:MAG: glycosyltransferase [Elusimicrobia bacterium]|nr:glycosyltransferase [Elusimicrobiota bacterium]